MAAWARWCSRHQLVVLAPWLGALLGRVVGRAGRWLPAGIARRLPRRAGGPGAAGPPAPEDLEVLVAAALKTPRPPVSPGPAGGCTMPPGTRGAVRPVLASYETAYVYDTGGTAGERPAYGGWEPEGPGARPGVVHGFVVTPDGDPIHSVTLTLLSRSGRRLDRVSSLADGSYVLTAPAPGVYLLAAAAPGYASRARHILLGDGPLTYDLELVEAVGGGMRAVT